MYLILNRTNHTCLKHSNDFPNLDYFLDNGDDIIVISMYSDTIKVPYCVESNNTKQWEWKEYYTFGNISLRIT